MSNFKNMSRQEQLEAIAAASRGERQSVRVRPATLEEENAVPLINPQVEPPRVDPELAAQLLMRRRIEAAKAANPESVVQEGEMPQEAPYEDQIDQARRERQIRALQSIKRNGQLKNGFE
mgnify:CR=1 FL=1